MLIVQILYYRDRELLSMSLRESSNSFLFFDGDIYSKLFTYTIKTPSQPILTNAQLLYQSLP